jgi:hypothetical protein
MEQASSVSPSVNDIIGGAIAALDAGEMLLPDMEGHAPGIQAAIVPGAAVPGLGVVTSSETGQSVFVLTFEACRGTAEYERQYENCLKLFRIADESGLATRDAGEVFLEETIHEFLHDAWEAPRLDAFLQLNLLPQLIDTWALTDAYSRLVLGRLPSGGEQPLEMKHGIFAEIDPYGDCGLVLAIQLWDYTAREMHDRRVHDPDDPQESWDLGPVPREAGWRTAPLRCQ